MDKDSPRIKRLPRASLKETVHRRERSRIQQNGVSEGIRINDFDRLSNSAPSSKMADRRSRGSDDDDCSGFDQLRTSTPKSSSSSIVAMVNSLHDANLCGEFSRYLKRSFCDENLSFHLDVRIVFVGHCGVGDGCSDIVSIRLTLCSTIKTAKISIRDASRSTWTTLPRGPRRASTSLQTLYSSVTF